MQQTNLISGTGNPLKTNWGSDKYEGNFEVQQTQHIQFAPMPTMYIPGVYPVYSEFPQLSEGSTEQGATSHEDSLAQQTPSISASDTATADTAESASIEGLGKGLRHPRYSRRVQSKSEPSSNGTISGEA